MEFADSVSFGSGGKRAAQGFSVLPCVRQTGTEAFAQDFALELSEDGQHCGHGAAGGCGQVERFRSHAHLRDHR
jgi:hypothetical protein